MNSKTLVGIQFALGAQKCSFEPRQVLHDDLFYMSVFMYIQLGCND
jgi:hypothetical protein